MPMASIDGSHGALGAEFNSAFWDFIGEVREGSATPRAALFDIACALAGLWEGTVIQLHMRIKGSDEAEALAYVDELITAQRQLYGSLATPGNGDRCQQS